MSQSGRDKQVAVLRQPGQGVQESRRAIRARWLVAPLSLAIGVILIRLRRLSRDSSRAIDPTSRIARQYDEMANRYDSGIRLFERILAPDGRRWVTSRVTDNVLEIAVGTGRNLPSYARGVSVTGIDISPAMLEIARRRASECGTNADLRVGDAQALDFPDDAFDSVVSTLTMCTIPDHERAIAEVRRVLRPGGRFVLLEHVRSPNRLVRGVQQLLDPLSVRVMCDHLLREPVDVLRATGFEIIELERSKLGIVERVVARKPA